MESVVDFKDKEYQERVIQCLTQEILNKVDLINKKNYEPQYIYVRDQIENYLKTIENAYKYSKISFENYKFFLNKASFRLSQFYQDMVTTNNDKEKTSARYYQYIILKRENLKLQKESQELIKFFKVIQGKGILGFLTRRNINKLEVEPFSEMPELSGPQISRDIVANIKTENKRMLVNNYTLKIQIEKMRRITAILESKPFIGSHISKKIKEIEQKKQTSANTKKQKIKNETHFLQKQRKLIKIEIENHLDTFKTLYLTEKNSEAYYYYSEIKEYYEMIEKELKKGTISEFEYITKINSVAGITSTGIASIQMHKKELEDTGEYSGKEKYDKYFNEKRKNLQIKYNLREIKKFITKNLGEDWLIGEKVLDGMDTLKKSSSSFKRHLKKKDISNGPVQNIDEVILILSENNKILTGRADSIKLFLGKLFSDRYNGKRISKKYKKWNTDRKEKEPMEL